MDKPVKWAVGEIPRSIVGLTVDVHLFCTKQLIAVFVHTEGIFRALMVESRLLGTSSSPTNDKYRI